MPFTDPTPLRRNTMTRQVSVQIVDFRAKGNTTPRTLPPLPLSLWLDLRVAGSLLRLARMHFREHWFGDPLVTLRLRGNAEDMELDFHVEVPIHVSDMDNEAPIWTLLARAENAAGEPVTPRENLDAAQLSRLLRCLEGLRL